MASNYVLFWGGPFSQWYKSSFVIDGITFNTCEQYMMYKKAVLFGDHKTAESILKTSDPKQQKRLGRQVKNFNDSKWMEHAFDYVVEGNIAKFSQNDVLYNYMFNSKGKTFVEASPLDTRWGIGLAADHPDAKNPSKWKGENLLGKALNETRLHIFGF